jgi:hypothetical protein
MGAFMYLKEKIKSGLSIRFVEDNASIFENTTNYVGDDVGIERIFDNYDVIINSGLTDDKDIEATEKFILELMQQYINDNLE